MGTSDSFNADPRAGPLSPDHASDTAFKQQRLKAWQPLLTPKSVLPTLFILGVIFAPLGAFLLHTSNSVSELIIDYSECREASADFAAPANNRVITSYSAPGATTSNVDAKWKYQTAANPTVQSNACTVRFTLPQAMPKPVFMYYRLTNFYQNHRRSVT